MNRMMKHLVPFNKPISKDLIKKNIFYTPLFPSCFSTKEKKNVIKIFKSFTFLPGDLCFGVEIYKTYIQ